ncbi:MAG: hypothetical protein KAU17_08805 [Spirochaetales bacterium]|nr:hypothetical protein [Spirochaetales bacterium]
MYIKSKIVFGLAVFCFLFLSLSAFADQTYLYYDESSASWVDMGITPPENAISSFVWDNKIAVWTDSGKVLAYNSINEQWEEVNINFPSTTKQVTESQGVIIILTEDNTFQYYTEENWHDYFVETEFTIQSFVVRYGVHCVDTASRIYSTEGEQWDYTEVDAPLGTVKMFLGSGEDLFVLTSDKSIYKAVFEEEVWVWTEIAKAPSSGASDIFIFNNQFVLRRENKIE